jgi:hypothetical protein
MIQIILKEVIDPKRSLHFERPSVHPHSNTAYCGKENKGELKGGVWYGLCCLDTLLMV